MPGDCLHCNSASHAECAGYGLRRQGEGARYNEEQPMRITLPQRVPVGKAFLFTCLLFLVELVEGTAPFYAVLVFCYFMLSVFAFNLAGGFTRPSGAYVFYYSTLVAGVGTVYKAILGQAADTHLQTPNLVMGVYVATVAVLLCSVFLTRRVVNTRDGIAGVLQIPKLDFNTSALGCVVMVILLNFAFQTFGGFAALLLHGIALVNYFLPLSILLGTIAAVKSSGGRRSTSPLTIAVLVYSTYTGLLVFGKQAMFTPFVCWVLGMAWSRFQLRPRHLITIVLFIVVAQGWMVPLANVGREELPMGTHGDAVEIVEYYIQHPLELRETNRERQAGYLGMDIWYYGTPQGLFDRLTMLPNDAQLISYTADGHYFGYLPLIAAFENWVPHIIAPHKLEGVWVGGNRYAHELGQLADEDMTTGISFSPSGEAFHMDGFRSVLFAQPLVFFILFVTVDFVCGDLRAQPWGLLPLLLFAHLAPEQLLSGSVNYTWLGNVGTIFAICVCGYVAPVFGRLLKGRERTTLWRSNIGMPVPGRNAAAEPA